MEKTQKDGSKMKTLFRVIPLIVLFSLFAFGTLFAEDPDTYTYETEIQKGEILPYWNSDTGWMGICIIAVLITAILHGMLFGIGIAINSQHLQRYAKSELLQTAATAVMLIVLLGMLEQAFAMAAGFGQVTCALNDKVITDPIEADMCYTQDLLNKVNNAYNEAFNADGAAGKESYYSFSFSFFAFPVWIGSLDDSIYKEIETYHSICYISVNLMMALSAKMFLLIYIQENMLAFFLPVGIILRTFHFTRGIGAFFIAMAIGFFFVYPITSFLMSGAEAPDKPEMPDIFSTGMCGIPIFGSFSFGAASLSQGSTAAAANQIAISDDLASFVADIQTKLLFNNLVAFAITITFLRYATTILGGDTAPFMGMVGRLI